MKREVDAGVYAKALEKLVIGMEQIQEENSPELQEVIRPFAELMRVGRAEAVSFANAGEEEQGLGMKSVFYANENACQDFYYSDRGVVWQDRVADYFIYPLREEPDWDEEERAHLAVLVKILHIFNRRMMVLRMGRYRAIHEPVFGMYNVNYFVGRLMEYSKQHILGEFVACYFNIKRMSVINEEYGREKGTRFLKSFLARLEAFFTDEREFISRVSSDNFIFLFRREHMDQILAFLEGTVIADEEEPQEEGIRISTWAGVYLLPETIESPDGVMDGMAFAISAARNMRAQKAVFFDAEMTEQFKESRRLQFLFAEALQKEEFQVYYQPKVLLKGYQLAGAEALCRWIHDGVMIMPGKFISVFEQSSRICQLDFYMLEHVCRDIRRWLDEGRRVVRISINLSRRHFGDGNLLEHILEIIDRNRVPHKYIEIELTETFTDVDFPKLRELVEGLKRQGIHTAVDDFGSGYSSLSLIKELPWDVLKLDKSFLDMQKEDDNKAKMMFGHVIAMARELGMECITEGVETMEQISFLKESNCYLAQGFFFDRPLPVAEFETRL